jgi:hypothetical protein
MYSVFRTCGWDKGVILDRAGENWLNIRLVAAREADHGGTRSELRKIAVQLQEIQG